MRAKVAQHLRQRLPLRRPHAMKSLGSQMSCMMTARLAGRQSLRRNRHAVVLRRHAMSPSPFANLNLNHASLAGPLHRSLAICAINRI